MAYTDTHIWHTYYKHWANFKTGTLIGKAKKFIFIMKQIVFL